MDNQNRSNEHLVSPESLERLQKTIRQQEAALRAKGRIVDNMAYQIRTLSNAIVGFSDLLLSDDLTPDQYDFAAEINSAGKGLSHLVDEVLDWAYLETGRLKAVRSETRLEDVLDELEQTVRPVADTKGLLFEIERGSDLPETVWTDEERLLKCLINLAANAVQYTSEGFVRIRVDTEAENGLPILRFAVSDSGPGIAPERLERLFEPSLDEEEAHAQVVHMLSFGLFVAAGLPLTRQLVKLLGGRIEVQSEVGTGSVFTLRMPAAADGRSQTAVEGAGRLSAGQQQESADEETLRPVLLAEDQESNRTVIRLMLKSMGFEVDTAVDGQEAVEMALSKQYSLILMDLKMPRMNGYDAAARLREKQNQVPIVALSALSLRSEEKDRIGELFDGFLSKPVDSEQLSAAVRRYAAGGRRMNAAGAS